MKEEVEKFIEEKRFNDLRKYLESMNSADFPSLFEEIEEEKIIVIYRILSKEKAAEVFAELDSDVQEKLINCFTEKETTSPLLLIIPAFSEVVPMSAHKILLFIYVCLFCFLSFCLLFYNFFNYRTIIKKVTN